MISSTAGKVTFEAEEITQRKVMLLLQLIGTQGELKKVFGIGN